MYERVAEASGSLQDFSVAPTSTPRKFFAALHQAALSHDKAGDVKHGIVWFEIARDASAQHGFVWEESKMCRNLARLMKEDGRNREGTEQNRRAVAVLPMQGVGENDASPAHYTGPASFNGVEDLPYLERAALREVVIALCSQRETQEARQLFLRLLEWGDSTADCRMWNHYLRGKIQLSQEPENADFSARGSAESFRAAVEVAEKHPEILEDPNANGAFENAQGQLQDYKKIYAMVEQAMNAQDWPGVLRWESRLEDILGVLPYGAPCEVVQMFAKAHFALGHSTEGDVREGHFENAARLFEKCVGLTGREERFRDQGSVMCQVGQCFLSLKDSERARTWFQTPNPKPPSTLNPKP
jgi:hypothetical protein